MQFGSETTSLYDPEGSTVSITESIHKGKVAKKIKHFRVKVKVNSAQEETTEFLDWSNKVRGYRDNKTLVIDREDPSSLPAFIIQYPKHDEDGSYFIIKCWAEVIE